MSPVKAAKEAAKEAGEFASPWAVIAMVAYMIYTGQAGGGMDNDDLAKVAVTAAVEVIERIDEKIDDNLELGRSNARRLDAIEMWIGRQESNK